jgi:hypothetical protein
MVSSVPTECIHKRSRRGDGIAQPASDYLPAIEPGVAERGRL